MTSDCSACTYVLWCVPIFLMQPQGALSDQPLPSSEQDLLKSLSSLLDYLPLATTTCRSHSAERVCIIMAFNVVSLKLGYSMYRTYFRHFCTIFFAMRNNYTIYSIFVGLMLHDLSVANYISNCFWLLYIWNWTHASMQWLVKEDFLYGLVVGCKDMAEKLLVITVESCYTFAVM